MKTVTFWILVFVAMITIFAGTAFISNPGESGSQGYLGAEPEEITVPVTVFDFTDEPPMLITPNNGPSED